jgi:predicted PolB exonuclease-like 3'-5' exonuclease
MRTFDSEALRTASGDVFGRISAPGLDARSYFNRYSNDAIDLCDVLSSFDGRSKMKLDELCRIMRLPGKPEGIDGSQVADYFAAGRITEIANYCECDVISTYRLWLLHELFRGEIGAAAYERSESQLAEFVNARLSEKPHWARLVGGPQPSNWSLAQDMRLAGE